MPQLLERRGNKFNVVEEQSNGYLKIIRVDDLARRRKEMRELRHALADSGFKALLPHLIEQLKKPGYVYVAPHQLPLFKVIL